MTTLPIIAQVVDWSGVAVQIGASGVAIFMLRWFMTDQHVRMKAMENADDRMARAVLILVIALRNANEAAREEARAIIKEIDVSQERERTKEK